MKMSRIVAVGFALIVVLSFSGCKNVALPDEEFSSMLDLSFFDNLAHEMQAKGLTLVEVSVADVPTELVKAFKIEGVAIHLSIAHTEIAGISDNFQTMCGEPVEDKYFIGCDHDYGCYDYPGHRYWDNADWQGNTDNVSCCCHSQNSNVDTYILSCNSCTAFGIYKTYQHN